MLLAKFQHHMIASNSQFCPLASFAISLRVTVEAL